MGEEVPGGAALLMATRKQREGRSEDHEYTLQFRPHWPLLQTKPYFLTAHSAINSSVIVPHEPVTTLNT